MKLIQYPRFSRTRTISDSDDTETPEVVVERGAGLGSIKEAGKSISVLSKEGYWLCLELVGLCFLWYVFGPLQNIIGKMLLTHFPYPLTCTMAQFLCTVIFSEPIVRCVKDIKPVHWRSVGCYYYVTMIVPLAFGKFIAAVSTHLSIWKVPVSYAHTVKATMPVFVVALSWLIMGERHTRPVLFSLLPIVGGVVMASYTEASFNMTGLLCALTATIAFSLQNIFSKKCLKETDMHQLRLLLILARIASCLLFPVWMFMDVWEFVSHPKQVFANVDILWTLGMLFVDAFCNFAQNIIAFTIIARVTPLTYAVCNCTKRIAIVILSVLVLKNPVNFFNAAGMSFAIFGVLLYNKAKYDQRREELREEHLPLSYSENSLSEVLTNPYLSSSSLQKEHLGRSNFKLNGFGHHDLEHWKTQRLL